MRESGDNRKRKKEENKENLSSREFKEDISLKNPLITKGLNITRKTREDVFEGKKDESEQFIYEKKKIKNKDEKRLDVKMCNKDDKNLIKDDEVIINHDIENPIKIGDKLEHRHIPRKQELIKTIKIKEVNIPIILMTKSEVLTGAKPIPIKIIKKVMKAICKITIEIKKAISHGTGFF